MRALKLVILPTVFIVAVNAAFGWYVGSLFDGWGMLISVPVALISGYFFTRPFYRKYFRIGEYWRP